MGKAPPYVMLMASLPALGPLLSERAPPISETRLERRLRELSPEDHAELERLRSLASWNRLDMAEEEAAFLARARSVIDGVRSPAIRALAQDRLEIRTLIAALRRRHAGEEAPAPGTPWGYGRFVETIRSNWGVPDFGVGRAFPWIAAAKEKLESGDRAGLERIVLEAAWAAGERRLALHDFDFEAVVLYVLRWSLVDRWSRYDAEAAAVRFAELLDQALADSPLADRPIGPTVADPSGIRDAA
ncbi:MAG: hypothetical protein ACM3ST_11545 [Bdellovibrio bacteriovorus]